LGVGFARTVFEYEVEAGEVQGPSCLAAAEILSCAPVLKIRVVCDDGEGFRESFQEVAPIAKSFDDG
jgi:hypothetical protein